jgi:acetyl esterase/lipase
MKKSYSLFFSVFFLTAIFSEQIFSQSFCGFNCSDCLNQKFIDDNQVVVIHNVSYASPSITNGFEDYQISGGGCNVGSSCLFGNDAAANSLIYDVYYPHLSCGTSPALPAVILFHEGGFGECTDKLNMTDYCKDFAQRGFVAFSVEYRRGKTSDHDQTVTASYLLALYRGIQDARGAIRSIIKRQNDGNEPYNIDLNKIFIGGKSEGGLIALNSTYLDQGQANKVFPGVNSILGNLDDAPPMPQFYYGESSIQYSIQGVLNMWDGLVEKDVNGSPQVFIDAGEPPFIGFHGELDSTVQFNAVVWHYSTGIDATAAQCNNINYTNAKAGQPVWFVGSSAIYNQCVSQNICAEVYLDSDMGHGFSGDPDPFGNTFTNKKKVEEYIVKRAASFFQAVLCGKCSNLSTTFFEDCVNSRCKAGTLANMNDNNNCLGPRQAITTTSQQNWKVLHADNLIQILFFEEENYSVDLFNLSGQKFKSYHGIFSELDIDMNNLAQGIYLLRISSGDKIQTEKIVR